MRNCLTVDVEEWFHVCGASGPLDVSHWDDLPSRIVQTTRDVIELLDECGARATFFVLGWIAGKHPLLIQEIAAAGHELASHGHWHRRVYELTPKAFADNLDASCSAMAEAGVRELRGYRAPEWSINQRSLWALDELARRGFLYDSSMAPLRIVGDPDYPQRPHVRQAGGRALTEFPPLVDRRFGQNMPLGLGWGLRMSSPSRVLEAIEARNARGIPVALAVHPWEFDPDPPRVRLPLARQFAHYFRLDGFRDRLSQVLRGGSFAPMSDVLVECPLET